VTPLEWFTIGSLLVGSHIVARLWWNRPIIIYEEVIVQ
jgi:hypothetical protein